MTPSPPALVTAAASSGPAATFIPVIHNEYGKPLRQHPRGARDYKQRRTCEEDGVLDAEEFGERCRDGGHAERRFREVEKTN